MCALCKLSKKEKRGMHCFCSLSPHNDYGVSSSSRNLSEERKTSCKRE